jgi:hypothetical protein
MTDLGEDYHGPAAVLLQILHEVPAIDLSQTIWASQKFTNCRS